MVGRYMRAQIWRLSWPIILEMSGQMVAGTVVTAMVGRLGAVSLTAVSLAIMVQVAATMTFAAAGAGAAAIVSRSAGAKDFAAVRVISGQALVLAIGCGCLVAAVGYLTAPLVFVWFNAEPAVADLAGGLLQLMFLFTPFYLVMAVSNYMLRAVGRTIDSFWVSMLNNSVNIVTSYLLIYGIGLPYLGAVGAAWGVGLGQFLGSILAVGLLIHSPLIGLRPIDVFTTKFDQIKRILAISIPAALEQVALHGGRIMFNFLLLGAGTIQFAGHQIAMQVESISYLPGFGFSMAVMTLVGFSLGQGVQHRAERYCRLTCSLGFWLMSAMGVVFFLFAKPLAGLFIQDQAVLVWAVLCIQIAALEQPTLAISYVMGGALRGAGDTRWPLYVTVICIWLVRLPLVYLFITVWQFPITAAWWITAVDFLLRSLILWWRFASGKWNRKL